MVIKVEKGNEDVNQMVIKVVDDYAMVVNDKEENNIVTLKI